MYLRYPPFRPLYFQNRFQRGTYQIPPLQDEFTREGRRRCPLHPMLRTVHDNVKLLCALCAFCGSDLRGAEVRGAEVRRSVGQSVAGLAKFRFVFSYFRGFVVRQLFFVASVTLCPLCLLWLKFAEFGDQRSEVRGQRSEVRGQRSEGRGQWAEGRGQLPEPPNLSPNLQSALGIGHWALGIGHWALCTLHFALDAFVVRGSWFVVFSDHWHRLTDSPTHRPPTAGRFD